MNISDLPKKTDEDIMYSIRKRIKVLNSELAYAARQGIEIDLEIGAEAARVESGDKKANENQGTVVHDVVSIESARRDL